PLVGSSILAFHDSVELFLQLASEYLLVGKKDVHFMEYWDLLKLPSGKVLAEKESMRRLNDSRVSLKHHGVIPSKLEIDTIRAAVTNFFETNTLLVFGFDFGSVSMLDLVQCVESKKSLQEGSKLIEEQKIEDALAKIAVAFHQLVDDYEDRKRTQFGQSPFFFGESTAFLGSPFGGLNDLQDFARKIGGCIEDIQDALRLL